MKNENVTALAIGAAAAIAIGLSMIPLPDYYAGIATKMLIYIGLATAWNIVGGIGGQLSLGHSVFIGLGALLPAAMLLKLSVPIWIGVACAAAISSAIGAAISWITFRFRLGHLYFALVTLAIGELGRIIVIGTEFLGGASGLLVEYQTWTVGGIRVSVAAQNLAFGLGFSAVTILTTYAILRSKLGFRLRALRGNESAAQAIGINLLRSKTIAMVISASLSSIGGSVLAHYDGFVDPEVVASPILIVPEGRQLFPAMTVWENLILGSFPGKARAHRAKRMDYVFDLFPRLSERKTQAAGTLSGGEQQMLAIGRALMSGPKLLILDEPSLGLSPKFVQTIFEALAALHREGLTILLVEQNLNVTLRNVQRCYVLERGEIVISGRSEDMRDDPAVKRAYLGT